MTECVGINNFSRNPIILPRRDYGTDLIIREHHERYKHGNHNTALSEVRMRYHIPKLLGEYRRVRRDCQWCKGSTTSARFLCFTSRAVHLEIAASLNTASCILAPHFGGCWERLVRSVKKVLHQFVFPKRPTDEVMLSTFTEIELILNSRPLTYVPLNDGLADPITRITRQKDELSQ
uniref:Integrase zinc-binding domain-containing protein n=1 Tax=Anopheles stephensi TaxID=30069 RepID=A0A182YT12_ANOST